MIKRILVPTDGSESAMAGAQYAVALARKTGAQVAALFVVDVKLLEGPFLRDLSASLGTAPYVNYQGSIARILEERGQAAVQAVLRLCEGAGVHGTPHVTTGLVPRSIVEQSELCDLIVLGRGGEHNPWLEGLIGSTTEAVVRLAPIPVLVTGAPQPAEGPIVAAYDGSHHARQALRAAVAIAGEWGRGLSVLTVASDGGDRTQAEAKAYLQSYGVEVQYSVLEGEAAGCIVRHAASIEAGLIAMGAYSHAKVVEWIVGSTTGYVLNHAPCPVLLTR